jgi:iron complex outermembrane receptor protein
MKIKIILFFCSSTFLWAETITLTPIDIQETVQSSGTVVLSEEEALETNSITLQERLKRDVSFSVVVDRKGEAAISFRGLDFKSTAYVEDGIPLYRNANGFTDTKFTMTNAVLQLNDGSGTSFFGVSPMGGEVQINSNNPSKEFETKLGTSISNNDEYYHAYVGSMADNFYMKADAAYYHRSDYGLSNDFTPTPIQDKGRRVNSDKDQKNVAIKSGIFIDEQIHLAGKVSVTRSEYGLPPNVYTDINSPVWDAYSRIDRKDLNSYYLYGDYSSDDLELSIRAYYDDYEDIYKIYHDPAYLSNWPAVTYDDDRLGTVLKGSKTYAQHKSTLVFLAEENEHKRSGGDLVKAKYKADTFKMSFMHLWELSSLWQVEGGVSYALMQEKEAADASALVSSDYKDALDAQLKLTYTQEQSEIYGSIAHKSRMPSLSEMFTFFPWENANPGLKPEKSMQYTVGYQQALEEKTFVALSVYYYDVDDLILYRDNGYINRENAKHYGTEIRISSSYFDKNALRFSYAYTHTRDSEGEDLELIPLHQVKIEDTLRLSANLNAYLGYQYVGSRYSANSATYSDEQLKLSGYHLVDTQFAYRLSSEIEGRAGIKNMLDESYEWEYGYPTQGRSYYVYLEWKL